jgi:hypothetical protein
MKSLLEGFLESRVHDDSAEPATVLTRIAGDLEMIAGVLATFPERNSATWNSAQWAKDRKDLEIACERMRAAARLLDELAGKVD